MRSANSLAWTPFLSASLMQAQHTEYECIEMRSIYTLDINYHNGYLFCNNTQSSDITQTHKTHSGALAPLLLEPSFPRSAHHLGTKVTCLTA